VRFDSTGIAFALLAVATPVMADGPGFDRPGISFGTGTLPPGSFDIEQGLPDMARDTADGTTTTLYSAGTLVRVGLAQSVELQLSGALLNRLDERSGGVTATQRGIGDSGVALKLALPSTRENFSWAALAGVTLDSGDPAFSGGATQYSLGVTGNCDLGAGRSLALYGNVDRAGSETVLTLSPAIGFALTEQVGGFVEAAGGFARDNKDYVAGGGLTWSPLPALQLDVYADFGLTSQSTDLQAGVGVSFYVE
jgi:hypothetical protein